MDILQNLAGRQFYSPMKGCDCFFGCFGGLPPMAETISQECQRAPLPGVGTPPVPAETFSRIGQRDPCDLQLFCLHLLPHLQHHDRAGLAGKNLQRRRNPFHRSQSAAHRPGRGVSITHRSRHIRDARTLVHCQDSRRRSLAVIGPDEHHLPAATMNQHVARSLRGQQGKLACSRLVKMKPLRRKLGGAAHLADRTGIGDGNPLRESYLHRATVTFVPLPTSVSMLNSLTRRLLPPKPSPMPDPEVNPSFSASSISGIPGPWSSKIRRNPDFAATLTTSIVIDPPLPWSNALRASSLAAVTSLV